MRSWGDCDQAKLTKEWSKLKREKQEHTKLQAMHTAEIKEIKSELTVIEEQVAAWDTKRFMLADLLGHINTTKQEIEAKEQAIKADKKKMKKLGRLLKKHAKERELHQKEMEGAEE